MTSIEMVVHYGKKIIKFDYSYNLTSHRLTLYSLYYYDADNIDLTLIILNAHYLLYVPDIETK